MPAALSYTTTTSRASPEAPIQVISVRAALTAVVSRYVPGAMTSVYPLPLAAFTATCTVVWSPRPPGWTYRVRSSNRADGDPYRPKGARPRAWAWAWEESPSARAAPTLAATNDRLLTGAGRVMVSRPFRHRRGC